jgi:hypothetical protein
MDALGEAKKLYQDAIDALSDERTRIEEDLSFTDPAEPDQWDRTERQQRETDPGGRRPCLTFDQIGQYVETTVGQVEQRPPSIAVLPVDGKADKRAAEKLNGLFRAIEYASRAPQHYATAMRSSARAGVGYLTLRPTVVDAALNYQEPRIGSVGDPLRAVRDPWAVEMDGSDATFGYVLTPLSLREFMAKHGKADPVSFGGDQITTDDDETVLVAEEWRAVDYTANCIVLADADGLEYTLTEDDFWKRHKAGEQLQPLREYRDKKRKIMWRTMSGAQVFEEVEYPAASVGLIPVYGYVGFEDGRLKFAGMGRKARDQQRAYNYHKSEERALMAQMAKAPWLVPLSALRDDSIKHLWDRASVESRAYLPFDDWDAENNRAISAPQKMQPAIDLRNHIMAAQEARDNIRAALGMYAPSLGEPSNAVSGVAIEAQKSQGESATALFPAHLAASVARVASMVVEMAPKLIDTKRQVRMMGLDGSASTVTVDPEMPGAAQETEAGLIINPNVGRYDVRATVGQAFTTQRTQAQTLLGEIMARNPQMAPLVAPLWAMNQDFQGSDKLAEVMIATLPPEVRAIFKPEEQGKPTTEALMQENAQLKQALQEATQIAQEAQDEIAQNEAEAEARERELNIKAYEAGTKRMQAMAAAITPDQVKALVVQTLETMLSQPAPTDEPPEAPEMGEPESYEMQPFPAEMNDPNAAMALEGMPDADA